MQPFKTLTAKTVVLPQNDIDTDQIIPARFLKVTTRKGLGKHAFSDWRYLPDGTANPDFPLHKSAVAGAQVIVAGDNFGCGSSREHAPWALEDYGIRAVISTSIADIFRNNATKVGLLPIVVDAAFHSHLVAHEGAVIMIDLEAQTISAAGQSYDFEIDAFARYCLLRGLDTFDYLLGLDAEISRYEEAYT